jgi:hypothetical protein
MIRRIATAAPVAAIVLAALVPAAIVAGCGGSQPETHQLERGGVNAVDLLQTINNRLVRVVGGITGTASAEAALPDLEMISSQCDDLLDAAKGMSPSGREELATQAARMLPGLRDNAVRIGSMRGGEQLAPVLREITDKIALLQ